MTKSDLRRAGYDLGATAPADGSGAPDNPAEDLLPDGALQLTGVVEHAVNQLNSVLHFPLTGSTFSTLEPSATTLTVNGNAVPAGALSVTGSAVTAAGVLIDRKNDLGFQAMDDQGRMLTLQRTIWAGGNDAGCRCAALLGGHDARNGSQIRSAIQAWAASNDAELSARGRIPANVIDQYLAAGN